MKRETSQNNKGRIAYSTSEIGKMNIRNIRANKYIKINPRYIEKLNV